MRKNKVHVVTLYTKQGKNMTGHTSAGKANAYVLNHIAKARDDFNIDPTLSPNHVKQHWHALTNGESDWSIDVCLIIS